MSEWKEYKLGDCVEMQKGFAFKSSDYINHGIKIIKVSNLNQYRFDDNSCVFISPILAEQYSRYSLVEDDIIISTVGSWPTNPESVVGKVCRVPKIINGSLLNQNAVRLRVKHNFNQRFLYYILSGSKFSSFIANTAQGSANQASITLEDIRSYEFISPSIKGQEEIVSILKSLDDKIEVNRRIIENLEHQAQTLFKHWFVDFAPFKDGKFVESEIGMIPFGWEYKSILDNEYFRLCKSKVHPFSGEKKYYATANVDGKDICGTPDVVTYDNRPSRADVVPCKNSIWFARMSKSYKILNCYGASNWLSEEAIISTGFCGITTEPEFYGFVYFYLISETFDKLKDLYATGTTQISLTNQGLANIKVLLPPKSEIILFSEFAAPIIEEIESCKYENQRLTEIRDNLVPRLMSGELKVNDIENSL